MTVKELIEKLKSYPPEVRVLVDGYDDNVPKVVEIKKGALHNDLT